MCLVRSGRRGSQVALPTQADVKPVLLQVLAELGGRARPREVYPRVTDRFPEITPEDLSAVFGDGRTPQWQNRIQWARQNLVDEGLIDASERGIWQLTPAGAEAAQRAGERRGAGEGDPADHVGAGAGAAVVQGDVPVTADQGEHGHVLDPHDDVVAPDGDQDAGGVGQPGDGSAHHGDGVHRAATAAPTNAPPIRPDEAIHPPSGHGGPEALIADLRAAERDSGDGAHLEQATANAFAFLGFDVETIGGPGRTDVVLVAPTGVHRYSVVVDAKSTARGPVSNAQVNLLAIDRHRRDERADYACIVGPGFAGGQLALEAQQFGVVLLATAHLAEVVRLHAASPLTLTELRPLFMTAPDPRPALQEIRAAAGARARFQALIPRVLAHIDSFNRAQPELILAKPETLLVTVLAEHNPALVGTTLEEVAQVCALLEAVGMLTRVNGEGFVMETSPRGARQLLAAVTGVDAEPA